MATERQLPRTFTWPSGIKMPVMLTFEHQSGEGMPLRPGDRPNVLISDQVQYGARTGMWNVLELLDQLGVKVTFFVSGSTAEKYPEPIRAAEKAGHEIAGMGYSFERVRTASKDRELQVIRRTVKALQDVCGTSIKGWRCPDYRMGPNTHELLAAEGFTWDSSVLNDDVPSIVECQSGPLLELPFTTSTADKTFCAFPYPMSGGPEGLIDAWTSEFNVLHAESASNLRYMMVSMQTWVTGRPMTLRVLKQFVQRIRDHNDIAFARCSDVRAWCFERVLG